MRLGCLLAELGGVLSDGLQLGLVPWVRSLSQQVFLRLISLVEFRLAYGLLHEGRFLRRRLHGHHLGRVCKWTGICEALVTATTDHLCDF